MDPRLVLNEDTYHSVIRGLVMEARRSLWIVTADLKDLYLAGDGGAFVPLLQVLAERIEHGLDVRLIHAKEPGPRFREDFDRFPILWESDRFDRVLCPRMHMKCVIADGKRAYIGSANLTGAGMGAKNEHRRNFEAGMITEDPATIARLMEFLDGFYLGDHCQACQRREHCPDPIA
ncbi:MAG: phosphatidylserine synthase [Verrucomicrobiales bacterium]|nr:phosphatidylserine synthase [Verrucomicrobiales bacterium]